MVWNGAADHYLDLQDFLAEPWNASWPTDLHVDGNRLRILGTAQQVIRQDRYEMDGGKVPVLWEITLRETVARRPAIVAAPVIAAAATSGASVPASDDELIAAVASASAQAIVDGNKDVRGRAFASADSFGDWGQPSIYVADEITPANFKAVDGGRAHPRSGQRGRDRLLPAAVGGRRFDRRHDADRSPRAGRMASHA